MPTSANKKDLKKITYNLAEKMDKFIRDKDLYNEFYDRYIAPDLEFSVDIFFTNGVNK